MSVPRARQAAALAHLLLLLSLHAQPLLAHRSRPSEAGGPEAGPSEAGALGQVAAEAGAHAAGAAGASIARAFLEALRSDEAEESAWCGFGYSSTMRWYHFEMDIVGEQPNHVRHFAVELIRAPKAPRLVMHAGMTWGVRKTDDSDIPLDWVLTPLDGAPGGYSVGIDFLYEVEYIRRIESEDAPNSLEIRFVNGTSMKLTGGLYYPDQVVVTSLGRAPKHHEPDEDEPEPEMQASETVNNSAGAGKLALRDGTSAALTPIARNTGRLATKGAIGGVAVGFGLSFTFSSAVVLMNSMLNSFLASVGTPVTLQLGVGIAPLTAAQIFTFTTCAGGAGLAAGAALGLGIGLVVGIPAGVAKLVRTWVKMRRELKLSASDKIYAKLDCHRHFKRCGWDGDILVPEGKKCPKN